MSLSDIQRERVIAVMDKLKTYAVSEMFIQSNDNTREEGSAPEARRASMDLTIVRRKLDEGRYTSVAAWHDDMELIWSNSLAIHTRTSLVGAITLEIQGTFRKLSQHITDNPDSDWLNKLNSLRDDLNAVGKRPCRRDQRAKFEKKPTPKKSQPQQTKPDIQKIITDIGAIRDDERIRVIQAIIEKFEGVRVEMCKLDISSLKILTLVAIREKLNQFAGPQSG